jgi:hypothetical protein
VASSFAISVQALRDITHDRLRIDQALADKGRPPDGDDYNDLFSGTGIAGAVLTAIGDTDAPSISLLLPQDHESSAADARPSQAAAAASPET